MAKTLFLPGAGASASFWKPVADLARLDGAFFHWPGTDRMMTAMVGNCQSDSALPPRETEGDDDRQH
jgi:hypothetical protein